MAKQYTTKCIVKKDHKEYPKGSIIDGLTQEEIKAGLKNHWLEAVGTDDEPVQTEEKSLDQMNKADLIAKAVELGVQVEETWTKEELRQAIREAMKA